MSYLSAATHADIIANPTQIAYYYNQVRSTFLSDLGSTFQYHHENHFKLAFCSVVAFDLKPYGSSSATELTALLNASSLDCDNYLMLTWLLYGLTSPSAGTEVVALGWNGGAIGNHAQMQARTSGSPDIMLDPTIGLVVHGMSLDALAKHFQVPASKMKSFFAFGTPPRTNISGFNSTVKSALQSGSYKATDLLYWIEDLAKLQQLPPREHWLTPQAE